MTSERNSYSGIILHLLTLIMIYCLRYVSMYGQPGGKAFQFLEVTNSARAAALGGDVVAVSDNDLDLVYHNPSLLSHDLSHHMVLNYVNYFAGINYGYASSAANLGKKSTVAGGIHYLNYGKFEGADESGMLNGHFRAADYSINAVYSRSLDSLFTFGFAVKSIFSDYEMYHSTALAIDAGFTYSNPEMKFAAGLVFRNMGFQIDTYYPNQVREPLPFNITLGISQGLKYAPLTFFVIAGHLERWDLTYETKEDEGDNGDWMGGSSSKSNFDVFIDKFMRHMIVGAEFDVGKNIVLRAGYNYRRRQEMKIDTKPGMVGFSWGIGIKISKFHINYGHSSYHLAGGTNFFSFSANLDEFNKKF
jgi:hypothetical protein